MLKLGKIWFFYIVLFGHLSGPTEQQVDAKLDKEKL